MPGFLQEHLRPLAGAAVLHLVLLAILAGAALRWTSSEPPVELAIQGYVVEGPVPVRRLPQPKETVTATAPPVATPPAPVAAPLPEPPVETPLPDAAEVERAAQSERERREAEERAAADAAARLEAEQAKARRKAEAEEAARQKAEAEQAARRKAEAEEAARKQAEAEEAARQKAEAEEAARRKAEAEDQARREAEVRAEREAALRQRLEAEEEANAFARSGAIDEYRSLLVQTIERNWIRPPSARAGLQCTLYVTQAPGGTVVDVRLGPCNGDAPVRESIVNAVYRSSPLPAPRDPRAFERRLEIVFKPTE